MKLNFAVKTIGWVAAIVILGWLGYKGKPINFDNNQDYLLSLNRQQEEYTSLNQNLLQSRYEVLSSYDALNQQILILKQLHQQLMDVPLFIERQGRNELQQLVRQNQALLVTQEKAIHQFKSEKVIFKNSLQYLPTLITETSTRLRQERYTGDPILMQDIEILLKQILVFSLVSDTSIESELRTKFAQLRQRSGYRPNLGRPSILAVTEHSNLSDVVDLVLRHTQVILERKPVVDQLLKNLLSTPTDQASEQMKLAYNRHIQEAVKTKGQYQLAAFFWLILIFTWVAWQVIHRIQRANTRTIDILESIKDAFIAIDASDSITYANPQAVSLLREQSGSLLQQNFFNVFPLSEAIAQTLKQFVNSESERAKVETFDSRSQRWFEVRAYRQQEGLSIFLQDISERKQVEITLQEMNQQLEVKVEERTAQLAESIQEAEQARQRAESSNQAKSIFLSQMSHELRTPLNSILGFAQILESRPTFQGKDREHLSIISRSGEHLLHLINDVLEVTKIEAGRADLYLENVDLHQLLEGLINLLNVQAVKKYLSLNLETASDLPPYIRTDANKLRQVLINLIGNAIKFTEQGLVTLEVSVANGETQTTASQSLNQQNLSFSIVDTGPGITPEDIKRMFEPFVQTIVSPQNRYGTGLGLPISRRFVQLMDGDLQVESNLGEGTRFHFTIPVEVVDAEDINAEAEMPTVIGLAPGQPRYRFLIVDDQVENRQLLRETLSILEVDFEEANDGVEAIALWESWHPDLIWMDMRMPQLDGYQAAQKIREREAQRLKHQTDYHPVKIVAVTASAFEVDKAQVLAAGCDDFVRKPFRVQELFERIAQHLGARFCYAMEEMQGNTGSIHKSSIDASCLLPSVFEQFPRLWKEQFFEAVHSADDRVMMALISQIQPKHPDIAQVLAYLVESFQLEVLIDLTQTF